MSDLTDTPKHKTFLGHPIGLYVLFFTEMWERFSYYGMRALLMLYMVNYFKWTQSDASSVYKWYTTLVYVTPILGGFMADRWRRMWATSDPVRSGNPCRSWQQSRQPKVMVR